MDYYRLGQSDLVVSRLGFGGCPLGEQGWGAVCHQDLIQAVRLAVDEGVNFFDTADVYGLGQSEKNLARALGKRRKDVIISTKFGVRVEDDKDTFYDNSEKWMRTALENSLRRLETDYIDLYQVHYWDGKTPFGEIFDVLERMRREGKIRYCGISNIKDVDFSGEPALDSLVSFSFEYSLAKREYEEDILRMAQSGRMGFCSWGSLGQGVLTGKYSGTARFPSNDRRSRAVYKNFHGEKFAKNLEIVEAMKKLLVHYPSRQIFHIAIRWIIDYLKFGSVLVGIKTPAQLKENLGAFGWNLRREDVACLASVSREDPALPGSAKVPPSRETDPHD